MSRTAIPIDALLDAASDAARVFSVLNAHDTLHVEIIYAIIKTETGEGWPTERVQKALAKLQRLGLARSVGTYQQHPGSPTRKHWATSVNADRIEAERAEALARREERRGRESAVQARLHALGYDLQGPLAMLERLAHELEAAR